VAARGTARDQVAKPRQGSQHIKVMSELLKKVIQEIKIKNKEN
jgi:hypothetical protein